MTTTDRCRHDMLIGTCDMCATTTTRATGESLILCTEPGTNNHRVHEPWCYTLEKKADMEPWPRTPITRQEAAGMTPCGHCQPSLPKAAQRP